MVRVLYVTLVARHVALGFDAVWYTLVSGEIAHGNGFVDPETFFRTGQSVATAAHAPLYPVFLAGITRMVNAHLDTFRVFGAVNDSTRAAFTSVDGAIASVNKCVNVNLNVPVPVTTVRLPRTVR